MHYVGDKIPDFKAGAGEESVQSLDDLRYSTGQRSTASLRAEMQKIMQDNAAVYRTQETYVQFLNIIIFIYLFIILTFFFL